MIKNTFTTIKNFLSLIIKILLLILIICPFIVFFFYLRSKNKTIKIKPKFEIIDANKENLSDLTNAIDEAKNILRNK